MFLSDVVKYKCLYLTISCFKIKMEKGVQSLWIVIYSITNTGTNTKELKEL